jgi:hypothetical protein
VSPRVNCKHRSGQSFPLVADALHRPSAREDQFLVEQARFEWAFPRASSPLLCSFLTRRAGRHRPCTLAHGESPGRHETRMPKTNHRASPGSVTCAASPMIPEAATISVGARAYSSRASRCRSADAERPAPRRARPVRPVFLDHLRTNLGLPAVGKSIFFGLPIDEAQP